jgi:hypothetical protein
LNVAAPVTKLEDSINGQILKETGTLAPRATATTKPAASLAQETPTGGSCTTRLYSYDQDTNRLSETTREPGVGLAVPGVKGTCALLSTETLPCPLR